MSEPTTIGVDLAKSVFQIAVSRAPVRVDEHHRLPRARVWLAHLDRVRRFDRRRQALPLRSTRGEFRHRLRAWALRLEARRGNSRAAVALANRLVRIAWAVWVKDRDFEPKVATEAV